MQILAHRGFWETVEEKNTLNAFERAFRHGYGIETDVRDYRGKLVVSHNIADGKCPMFEDVLRIYKETESNGYLAISIKADGIQDMLEESLLRYKIEKYFVFDMSIPEMVVYRTRGIRYFTRVSDYETEPVLLEDAMGVWMDEWEKGWIDTKVIKYYLDHNKMVGVISPEIHGRDEVALWNYIRNINDDRLLLCTDRPELFSEFYDKRKI